MRKKIGAAFLALSILSVSSVVANECVVEIQTAIDNTRKRNIDGMSALASNNFSNRPGTYSSMACLDQFMQGGMDIFFRPPDLNSLLQQVLGFACDQVETTLGGMTGGSGGRGLDGNSLLSSFSGGLKVPGANGGSSTINLSDYMRYSSGSGGTTSSLKSLFGGI